MAVHLKAKGITTLMKQRSRYWKIGQSVTRYSSPLGYGISLLLALWLAVATMVHLDYKQAVDEIEHNNEQLVRAFEAHVRSSFMVVDQQLLLIRAEYERAGITPAIRTILDQTRYCCWMPRARSYKV